MTGRIATFVLAAAIAAYGFGGTAVARDDGRDDVVFVREEDGNGVLVTETGDDDDDERSNAGARRRAAHTSRIEDQ